MKKRKIGLAVLIAATLAASAWVAVESMQWFDIPTNDHFAAEALGGDYEAAGKSASQMLRDARMSRDERIVTTARRLGAESDVS